MPPYWTECAMQTFFKGTNVKYFEVNSGMHRRNDLDALIDSVLEEANRRDEEWRLRLNNIEETNIVAKTPWLTRTGWEKTFLRKDMKSLLKLTEKPEEHEEELRQVWNSVSRMMESCWKGVENISDRNWDLILFWLNSAHPDKANTKPFRLDKRDNTVDRSVIFKVSTDG